MLQTFSGRRASQNEFELDSLIQFMNEHNVTAYLEIGARHGDTFHYVMSKLPAGSHGLAVDLPGGLWGRADTAKPLRRAIQDLCSKGYNADYLLGDSHEKIMIDKIFAWAKEHIPSGVYDAVLIDGDHTYKAVKLDYDNYGTHRIVAFHDIVGDGQAEKVKNNPVEVPKLWKELFQENFGKTTNKLFEFVDKDSKMGIGVIYDDSEVMSLRSCQVTVEVDEIKIIDPESTKLLNSVSEINESTYEQFAVEPEILGAPDQPNPDLSEAALAEQVRDETENGRDVANAPFILSDGQKIAVESIGIDMGTDDQAKIMAWDAAIVYQKRERVLLNGKEAIITADNSINEIEHVLELDPSYNAAVAIVKSAGRCSVSMIQREFKLGYNRAARIIDAMEIDGIVSPADEKGVRQVING